MLTDVLDNHNGEQFELTYRYRMDRGRWIISPTKWNLALTERFVRKYASPEPVDDGTFTFYIARKK